MLSYQEVPRISFIPGRPVNELSGQTTLALSLLRDGGHSAVPAQALPQVARDKQGGGEGGGRGKGGVRGTLFCFGPDDNFLSFFRNKLHFTWREEWECKTAGRVVL